ncbi:MAG: hypothetical protein O3C40_32515 [Planctomycetota bacterium]|nr:hypothetical protein [Planctomycetota bacterium]
MVGRAVAAGLVKPLGCRVAGGIVSVELSTGATGAVGSGCRPVGRARVAGRHIGGLVLGWLGSIRRIGRFIRRSDSGKRFAGQN